MHGCSLQEKCGSLSELQSLSVSDRLPPITPNSLSCPGARPGSLQPRANFHPALTPTSDIDGFGHGQTSKTLYFHLSPALCSRAAHPPAMRNGWGGEGWGIKSPPASTMADAKCRRARWRVFFFVHLLFSPIFFLLDFALERGESRQTGPMPPHPSGPVPGGFVAPPHTKAPPFQSSEGNPFSCGFACSHSKALAVRKLLLLGGKNTHTHTHALAHCTDSLTRSFAGVGRCFYIFNCLLIATRVTTGCCGRCADALDARAHKGVCAKPLPKCTTTNRECIKCGVRCVCVCVCEVKGYKGPR